MTDAEYMEKMKKRLEQKEQREREDVFVGFLFLFGFLVWWMFFR